MIADLLLLRFLIYLSRTRRYLSPRIDRWIQDGVFQLQRRAYESHGQGTWENLDQPVPTTTTLETLSDLPINSLPQHLTMALSQVSKHSAGHTSSNSSLDSEQRVLLPE